MGLYTVLFRGKIKSGWTVVGMSIAETNAGIKKRNSKVILRWSEGIMLSHTPVRMDALKCMSLESFEVA
jgi:hypothetical protein